MVVVTSRAREYGLSVLLAVYLGLSESDFSAEVAFNWPFRRVGLVELFLGLIFGFFDSRVLVKCQVVALVGFGGVPEFGSSLVWRSEVKQGLSHFIYNYY